MATETHSAAHNPASDDPAQMSEPGAQMSPEASDGTNDQSPVEKLRTLGRDVSELKDYAAYFLAAKADQIKLSLRNAAVYAVLGIVGLIAAAAMICTAVVLLVVGLSELINTLVGHAALRPWLGNLIVAILCLGGIGAGAYIGINKVFNASRKRTISKYENRRRQQTIDHGCNVHQRAEERQGHV